MQVIEAPNELRGIDCNRPIELDVGRQLMKKGFRFVCRYVPRVKAAANDITMKEFAHIFQAGLGLMIVQHVENEGWIPSAQKGDAYGRTAAECASQILYPVGAMLWLDLEGVGVTVPTGITIEYCKRWYKSVAKMGYTPGLYVGFDPGISASDLYYRLPFEHYWGAYNVDNYPVVRGFQMKQEVAINGEQPEGWQRTEIDTNLVERDHKGGLPLVCAPDEWDV